MYYHFFLKRISLEMKLKSHTHIHTHTHRSKTDLGEYTKLIRTLILLQEYKWSSGVWGFFFFFTEVIFALWVKGKRRLTALLLFS